MHCLLGYFCVSCALVFVAAMNLCQLCVCEGFLISSCVVHLMQRLWVCMYTLALVCGTRCVLCAECFLMCQCQRCFLCLACMWFP